MRFYCDYRNALIISRIHFLESEVGFHNDGSREHHGHNIPQETSKASTATWMVHVAGT